MGGGGNFFSQIGNALASVVGAGPTPPKPPAPVPPAVKEAVADVLGTNNTASTAKQSSSASAMSQSNQAANANAGSGTMLTGTQGVDPQSLELGKKTLLGG